MWISECNLNIKRHNIISWLPNYHISNETNFYHKLCEELLNFKAAVESLKVLKVFTGRLQAKLHSALRTNSATKLSTKLVTN